MNYSNNVPLPVLKKYNSSLNVIIREGIEIKLLTH